MLAALGEPVAERSGVLNLGVEGMMLLGALAAFAVASTAAAWPARCVAGCLAGGVAALVFAFLTLTLQANQVATGLSLTILGTGVSAFIGRNYVGNPAPQSFAPLPIPGLSRPAARRAGAVLAEHAWLRRSLLVGGRRLVPLPHARRAGAALGGRVAGGGAFARPAGHPASATPRSLFGGLMGGPGRLLLRGRAVQDVAGGPHLGQRLDRARAGGVRELAAGARGARRAAVRRA